ncbi:uncharacterized protein LOC143583147, partial [Bidens hawaiensis]|uniref:uncharacterized protein LOC143583147 n=1 Tax=Bidens hawaiensis TaxID=980011 RepID=UPI00404A5F93
MKVFMVRFLWFLDETVNQIVCNETSPTTVLTPSGHSPTPSHPTKHNNNNDETFISALTTIVRHNQPTWPSIFNTPSISNNLQPHHVILRTLDDPRLASRFFNFLGLHKNFNHSTTSFCILVHALVESSFMWPASSLVQTLLFKTPDPRVVFEHFHNAFVSFNFSRKLGFDLLYVQNKRVLDSFLILNLMKERGLMPEIRTVSDVFNGLVQIRRFDLVLRFYYEMVEIGVRGNAYIHSAVIRCLCELKDYDKAKEMIRWLECNGYEVNVVMYNVLIHGLCKGQKMDDAMEVKNVLGLKADVVTYCSLIMGCCRLQRFKTGRNLLNEMVELGFVPSEAVVSGVVDGLRRNGDGIDAYDLVLGLKRVGVVSSLYVYNALISSLCKEGRTVEADNLFRNMGGKGLKPNDITYSIVIDSLRKRGKLDSACVLLGEMNKSSIQTSIYPYNALINGCCKLGKLAIAESLFEDMVSNGVNPTVVTYTCLIDVYCKHKDVHKALRLYHEMTGKKIFPNVYTFTSLISGFCNENMMSQASDLFHEMMDKNVTPDEITYSVMIEGYCREGDMVKAFELLDDMEKKGLKPNTYTFRSLITGLCDINKVYETKEFVNNLNKQHYKLNEMCYSALLQGYCQAGHFDDAINACNEMEINGIDMELV